MKGSQLWNFNCSILTSISYDNAAFLDICCLLFMFLFGYLLYFSCMAIYAINSFFITIMSLFLSSWQTDGFFMVNQRGRDRGIPLHNENFCPRSQKNWLDLIKSENVLTKMEFHLLPITRLPLDPPCHKGLWVQNKIPRLFQYFFPFFQYFFKCFSF